MLIFIFQTKSRVMQPPCLACNLLATHTNLLPHHRNLLTQDVPGALPPGSASEALWVAWEPQKSGSFSHHMSFILNLSLFFFFHREIFLEFESNSDCNCTFPIDLAPNGIKN